MTLTRRSRRAAEAARDALWQEVYALAHQAALRAGVPPQDAEDCALTSVERGLLDEQERALRPAHRRGEAGTLCPAWVCRSARNHARNFRRHRAVVTSHEAAWPQWQDASGETAAWEVGDGRPGPEALLLHGAAWRALGESLGRLAPGPRAFVVRRHWGGESAGEIAGGAGRTAHAVEQALSRSYGRLRGLLARQGVCEADLCLRFARAPEAGPGRGD